MRGVLTVIFFTCMIVPLFADYSKALDLYKQGKYQDSLKIIADDLELTKDFDANSQNFQLRFLAAHNHRKLGNIPSAIIHFQRCSEIRPKAVEPLIDLAFIMIDIGKYRDAAAYAQKAVSLDPKNAVAFYLLGLSSYRQGIYWGAKDYLEKATAFDPELYMAWNTLGMTLMALKKYPDADTAFSTALAMNPDTAEILNNLAVCEARQGRLDEAKKTMEKAEKLDANSDRIKKNKEILNGIK
jgi:tetratricopeptide (TPR) repeat protein